MRWLNEFMTKNDEMLTQCSSVKLKVEEFFISLIQFSVCLEAQFIIQR